MAEPKEDFEEDKSEAYYHAFDEDDEVEVGPDELDSSDDEIPFSKGVLVATRKALGDVSPRCPQCGALCVHHAQVLRDIFIAKAGNLAAKLAQGAALYQMEREFGCDRPSELVTRLYEYWQELFFLYPAVEPQEEEEVVEEAEEETSEE